MCQPSFLSLLYSFGLNILGRFPEASFTKPGLRGGFSLNRGFVKPGLS